MELPRLSNPDLDASSLDHCFGCGEKNLIGLHLKPHFDGEKVSARFTPQLDHQGWHNVTHGGILYSVLDEITAYVVLCSGYSFGVTARSAIRFRHVAPTDQTLIASAWATKVTPRLIDVHGVLEVEGGEIVTEIDSTFIPGDRYRRAFLWDMDGVIVDSAEAHFQSWQDAFSARGTTYTEEQFRTLFGTRDDHIINEVMGSVPQETVEEIAEDKEQRYRDLVRGRVNVFPGVLALLRAMKHGGYPIALGTSAPRENVDAIMHELGMGDLFDVIVCGEDVNEGKPSPEIYLEAARRLGVSPSHCVVFEDAPLGVEAAVRGGMKCVAVTNSHPAEALQGATRVVGSMEEMDLVQLIRWL